MSLLKKQALWRALFFLYLMALLVFVVLKFDGSVSSITNRIALYHLWEDDYGFRPLNFIPFWTIRMQLRDHGSLSMLNLVANVAAFLPLGMLLPCAFRKTDTIVRTLLLSMGLSIAIELFQLVTYTGSCDIDDVLLNTLGALLGYGLFKWWSGAYASQP